MKKRVFIITLMVMLFTFICAKAEETSYLVKFKAEYQPYAQRYNITVVNEQAGIYLADSEELPNIPEEYIEYSEPNEKVSLIEGIPTISLFGASDQYYSQQWHLQMINGESSWAYGAYGNDVKVAVIDSGCYPHNDLRGNLLPGKNYLDGSSNTTDENGHGTHVSGIIAAEMNSIGICGVAPKAKIVPLKCFGETKEGDMEDTIEAIYDAVDVYGCQVINMSWGGTGNNRFLKAAIDHAYSKGAILVAAVGNESSTALNYPAAYQNVIGVGSVTKDKEKSDFSQYNNSVTVVAPGEDVPSTFNNGRYVYGSGTSQATPFVSGIAAVALSMDPTLTNGRFSAYLKSTATDLGTEGYDTSFGSGLVNEAALLEHIQKSLKNYSSPINVNGTDATVVVKNNNTTRLIAISFIAQYGEDDVFLGGHYTKVNLLPGESTTVSVKTQNPDRISHMLWNMQTLAPLNTEREKR